MLTYSTIVFCSSTGKAKIGGFSGALDSAAAEEAEEGWVMMSRLGVVVVPPVSECDMVRKSRCVRVAERRTGR